MRFTDYPGQEPSNPAAASYRDACVAGSFGVPFTDISFGPDPHQSIAIYQGPRNGGKLFAFIHGGGWTNGYKETMGFMAPAFIRRGIAFASIGYRLAPASTFPSGLTDCALAIAELVRRSAEFGWDPSQIYIGGHSSGGHYAALLAVRRDWPAAFGLPADVISGCLPISGVYRLGPGSGLAKRPRVLADDSADLARSASPVELVEQAPPRFLIAYGERDFPHLLPQAEEMTSALRAKGGTVETMMLPGRDHFTASLAGGEEDGAWVAAAAAFIGQTP